MKPLDKPLWFFSRIEFSFISFTLKFLVFSLESKVAKHNLHIKEVIWSFFISNIYNIPFTTYNTMLWRKMMLICYKGRNARIQTHEIHLTCKDYFYKAGTKRVKKTWFSKSEANINVRYLKSWAFSRPVTFQCGNVVDYLGHPIEKKKIWKDKYK